MHTALQMEQTAEVVQTTQLGSAVRHAAAAAVALRARRGSVYGAHTRVEGPQMMCPPGMTTGQCTSSVNAAPLYSRTDLHCFLG